MIVAAFVASRFPCQRERKGLMPASFVKVNQGCKDNASPKKGRHCFLLFK